MADFGKTKKFIKANIRKVPIDKTIVYKIKNGEGENLYTGIAGRERGQERLLEHKELKSEVIPGGTRFQFAQVKNKKIAERLERQIIKKEKPKYNEQGK